MHLTIGSAWRIFIKTIPWLILALVAMSWLTRCALNYEGHGHEKQSNPYRYFQLEAYNDGFLNYKTDMDLTNQLRDRLRPYPEFLMLMNQLGLAGLKCRKLENRSISDIYFLQNQRGSANSDALEKSQLFRCDYENYVPLLIQRRRGTGKCHKAHWASMQR